MGWKTGIFERTIGRGIYVHSVEDKDPKILSEVVTQKKLFKNDYQNMIENLIQHFSRWKNTKRPRYRTIVDLVGML